MVWTILNMKKINPKFKEFLISTLRTVGLYILLLAFFLIFYTLWKVPLSPLAILALGLGELFLVFFILDTLDKQLHFGSYREKSRHDDYNEDFDENIHDNYDENIHDDENLFSDNNS